MNSGLEPSGRFVVRTARSRGLAPFQPWTCSLSAGFGPLTKLGTTENGPKRLLRLLATVPPPSWKIKQIQHPHVRKAFRPCSDSTLIFHGHLVLILVGIIDLERALLCGMKGWAEKKEEKKKESSIMVLKTREGIFPFFCLLLSGSASPNGRL